MPNDAGRWPTDEFARMGDAFTDYLSPHNVQLKVMSKEVLRRKHPWGYILAATIIVGIALIIWAWGISDILRYGAIALLIAGFAYVFPIYSKKSKLLREALDAVDHYIHHDIMRVEWTNPLESDPELLVRFQAIGAFGSFDDVKHIHSYLPEAHETSDAVFDPVFTHTRLTRTEVETYTDSQGRTKTRTKTVEVFHGIIFDIPFPDGAGDARTIISTKRIGRPAAPFDRRVNGKPIKMDSIKPASLEFQKLYKVKCDDEMIGHHILDPDRVMRFINMHHDLRAEFGRGMDIIMLITDGRAWVGIETGALQGITQSAGKIEKLAPGLTKFARQLSARHIIASHLKLPQSPSFPWQHNKPKS